MPRLIYSLEFEVTANGESATLIAPLGDTGQSQHITPEPPKRRVIDLRTGDFLRHNGKRYRVKSVRAYREHRISRDAARGYRGDGYIVWENERDQGEQGEHNET